jgi:hypothetical protein
MSGESGPFVPFTLVDGGYRHTAMQKTPPKLQTNRLWGKFTLVSRPKTLAFRDCKSHSHPDKSLKHFSSRRPTAIYFQSPSHQLYVVALPRTSWEVTGPPTTSCRLTT